MIWSVAWRNVWRNKLRSSVVIIAIALGLFAGVFSTAFMRGMSEQRISSAIQTEISHLQIHEPKFRDNTELSLFISNADSMVNLIKHKEHVIGVSKRIIVNSMVSSAETGAGVSIQGVVPEQEKKVTNIHEKLVEGEYLTGVKRNPVVIGQELAEKLQIGLHSKLVITLQDIEGNISRGLFRVSGIYKINNSAYEEVHVFVKYDDLARITGLDTTVAHEIPVLLESSEYVEQTQSDLSDVFPNMEVMPWNEISPEVGYLNSVMDQYMYIFIIIILLALCFGIINTMLMVVLERVRELGMLMAIGMNKVRIFFMIMLESVFLSLSGGVVGILIGYVVSKYFETHGIPLDAWAEGLTELGYSPETYTTIDFEMLIIITVLVIMTGIISAIYPAIKALKLNPAESIAIG